ncbi:MAG: hypothetical protein H0T79_21515 [Deltaproteobacteria bacterium]|nr:hypothetical protein [Deltaproteobacteria bacterium]
MGRKRPERTERRTRERAARQLVRDREKLAALSPGGGETHPIVVTSSAVIDVRINAMPCPQCEGQYRLVEHAAPGAGLRKVDVTCRLCGVSRVLWFRLAPVDEPN